MTNIRRVELSDLESFNTTLNDVIKEKVYLASADEISMDDHKLFLKNIVNKNLAQLVAVDGNEVVGWCDILPRPMPGYSHVGSLGMGIVKSHRNRGLGKRLLKECVVLAKDLGLEKVELEVFTNNITACSLYSNFGFLVEGVRKKSRKLNGQYQDIQLMSFWLK